MDILKKLQETLHYIKNQGVDNAEVGIVLGTGLGAMVNEIEVIKEIPYGDIPHFPIATVEFHSGKLIYGKLAGKTVLCMNGRFHYYEGYNMEEITYPIRLMKMLNVQYLFLSNAAGAINLDFKKGDLMLLDDHINLQPENPLRGPNLDSLGPRFPDMSEPYSPLLNDLLKKTAKDIDVELHTGVYVSVTGPNLETRAEYRMLGRMGADAVGMSTVPAVIVANHMELPCATVSVLTDECDPDKLQKVDIEDIIATAMAAEKHLVKLLKEVLARLSL